MGCDTRIFAPTMHQPSPLSSLEFTAVINGRAFAFHDLNDGSLGAFEISHRGVFISFEHTLCHYYTHISEPSAS